MAKKQDNSKISLDYGKIPPQALDLEEAVLGAIILEGNYGLVSHILKEQIFYKEAHQSIANAMRTLYEMPEGQIDMLTIIEQLRKEDKLEACGGAVYITELTSRVASGKHLLFHATIIADKYLLRELIRIGSEMQERGFDESSDPKDIAEWAEKELQEKFDLDIEGRATFRDALTATLLDISQKQQGDTANFIRTGDSYIDERLSLRGRSVCLIAGPEGCGKTKYVTHICKGALDNNDDPVAILWFSMEDSKEQIVRSFISMDARLTTKQMQSINYALSEDEQARINKIANAFANYNIEFVDRVCTIRTIMRKARQFRERNPGSAIIVVIDNLGLIGTDSNFRGVEKDDYLAGKVKEISEQTEGSVILVHHMTKENAKALNIKDGYRPRKENIRGSSRIMDYVQQAILVNLPKKYKDLAQQERSKMQLFSMKEKSGSFDFERFMMEFWSINPKGDKETQGLSDLPKVTWDELRLTVNTDKAIDGGVLRVSYLIKKYAEYVTSIDDANQLREERYHTKKVSIYTFLRRKMWNEDFSPQKNTRTYYLYGNDLSLISYFPNLFIAEIVKNRDAEDDDEFNILRYKTELGFNIYEPLISKSNEQEESK
jgi:replicative DNA helicase